LGRESSVPVSAIDAEVRIAAFDWLRSKVGELGDVLPRDLLARGFEFRGERVPLLGPQGIFKPRILPAMPLSITTAPAGPYDDGFRDEGLLHYKYRGTDPAHRDNAGLREAMRRGAPLIYFHGIMLGRYVATWPVFVVGDDPGALTFRIEVDDVQYAEKAAEDALGGVRYPSKDAEPRRAYVTAVVRQRLHQRAFRERVLEAYRNECALCRLRHRELLEAAHIIPDGEPGGDPVVQNGVSLCALHHAAFDGFLIGIRPDLVVQVRASVLREEDGPMLRHGLQGLHNTRMRIPRASGDHPARELLARRWERFAASA
jgi:putative restriction endonuclease